MGKHVRTLIGEGAPPPWVPFGTKNTATGRVFLIVSFLLNTVFVDSGYISTIDGCRERSTN